MRRTITTATIGVMAIGLLIGTRTIGTIVRASEKGNDNKLVLLDNCAPTDPAWGPLGGCLLKSKDGDITVAEFTAFLFTTLSPPGALIGHPSWRIQPSYVSIGEKEIRVQNGGGRPHTFTEVANYGGGFVMQLNGNLTPAPECLASPSPLAPGATEQLNNLRPGLYKFQCCIHPWMRTVIRVE